MAQALFGIILALCLGLSVANAQTTRQNPSWNQLGPDEQRILAPIKDEWDKLDAPANASGPVSPSAIPR